MYSEPSHFRELHYVYELFAKSLECHLFSELIQAVFYQDHFVVTYNEITIGVVNIDTIPNDFINLYMTLAKLHYLENLRIKRGYHDLTIITNDDVIVHIDINWYRERNR